MLCACKCSEKVISYAYNNIFAAMETLAVSALKTCEPKETIGIFWGSKTASGFSDAKNS
jgi:hypothetical protein